MNETLHIKSVKGKIHVVVNDYIRRALPYTRPPKLRWVPYAPRPSLICTNNYSISQTTPRQLDKYKSKKYFAKKFKSLYTRQMRYQYYYFENVYTQLECQDILETASKIYKTDNFLIDRYTAEKKLSTICIPRNNKYDMADKLQRFYKYILEANRETFGFNVYPDEPLSLNINTYEVGNEYEYHIDALRPGSASDLKLTAILNTSIDSYEGGDLILDMHEEVTVKELKPGCMVIFPSNIYHKVTPIIQGKRTTLSCWVTGPRWA